MSALGVVIEETGKPLRTVAVEHFPCRIGKARDSHILLPGWRVGRIHAEIHRTGRTLKLVDLGTIAGTLVNGERIVEYGPLSERDEVIIGGFRVRFHGEALRLSATDVATTRSLRVARRGGLEGGPAGGDLGDEVDGTDAGAVAGSGMGADGASTDVQSPLDESPPGCNRISADPATGPVWAVVDADRLALLESLPWRRLVHRRLLERIDLRRSNLSQYTAEQLRIEVRRAVVEIVAEIDALPATLDRERLVDDTIDEAVGYGPLERLLADPDITEIMVNGAVDVFVERRGLLERATAVFTDDTAIRNVIERIVAPLGRRIDEASPLVDARLPDGSRVNAVIPPIALRGPTITIRRFNRAALSPDDLVELGTASRPMIDFLGLCVSERRSLVVSGGTGSGKTTLLNVLSNLVPEGERLITIEDAAELKLHHAHLVSLEARPANAEGRGAVTIRDLVRNALRMRPDRIIVGECRGAEALDMLQAMNTGHEGSLTTVHANTPRDALSRLEVLTLMGGIDLPVSAIRDQIASAVDLIVHQARLRDGTRRITSITEVVGVESGRIQSQEIFRFEATGFAQGRIIGRHVACGTIPAMAEAMIDRGVAVDLRLFQPTSASGESPAAARGER